MVKYQKVVLLIPDCMCVTHRSSCLSSFTFTFGVFGHSYRKWSTCTWRRCRTFSNLVLVAGHLFRQERKLSSASAISEVRSEITTSLPVYSQERFISHQSGNTFVPFRQILVHLSLDLFLIDAFKPGPCYSPSLLFLRSFLLWFVGVFFPTRKEIEFVLKPYHIKWFAAPFSSSVITCTAPLPPRKRQSKSCSWKIKHYLMVNWARYNGAAIIATYCDCV